MTHTTGFLLAAIPVVALMSARPIGPVLITIYVCIGTLQHANLRWTSGLDGRPVPVEQEAAAEPALLLLAGQLAEPFRARA